PGGSTTRTSPPSPPRFPRSSRPHSRAASSRSCSAGSSTRCLCATGSERRRRPRSRRPPLRVPCARSRPMRLLNQVHTETEAIRGRFPAVEVVEVPNEGDVDPGLEGDALLTVGALAANLGVVAGRVQWVHNFGTGLDGLPDEAFCVPVLTCSRGAGAVPISEF